MHANLAIESVCKLFFVIVCVHILVSVKLEYFHSFTVIPATPILLYLTITMAFDTIVHITLMCGGGGGGSRLCHSMVG